MLEGLALATADPVFSRYTENLIGPQGPHASVEANRVTTVR